MKRVLATLALLGMCVSACGESSSSPSTSTPTPSPNTRVISLSGNLAFGNVAVGQTGTAMLTILNSGGSTLTVSGMTVPSGSGGAYEASFTSGTITAGASQPVTIRFAPTEGRTYGGTLTVNGDHTSGANTIPISGTGTLSLSTVAGVLSEASGGDPIGGATVRVDDGPYIGRSSSSDGNGYYSIPGITGAVTLVAGKSGYDAITKSVTVSGDTRVDMTMRRTSPPPTSPSPSPTPPPPPPAPTPRYRIGAICDDGTLSSATGSGACSSHGGVRCWRYNDGTCTNP